MADFKERRWNAPDGVPLFARDYPAADGAARLPVICIHGLTRNAADFEVIAPVIAQSGRRVLAIDVRGRGRSDRARDPMTYNPVTYAQDVLALMTQLGIERAVFMGTSMGGLITMTLAALRSKVIAAAIVNDVGPEVDPAGLARISSYAGQTPPVTDWASAAAYARSLNEIAFPHYTDADWDAFARRVFRIGTEDLPILDYDPDIMVPIKAAGASALVPNLWPMWKRLAKARPTLVIRGEISDLLSPQIAARMVKTARKTLLVEIPGVGHAPMLDEPESRAAIFGFLAEVP